MKKTLVLLAHPHLKKSRANARIAERLSSLANLTVRNLYELYPYFHIDVLAEQELLRAHDIIVFQHPIQWYSFPPLLKLWFDDVLELGFAYGQGGNALKDKQALWSVTTGGDAAAYSSSGYHQTKFEVFEAPIKYVTRLCGMQWNAPHVLHGSLKASEAFIEQHAEALATRIQILSGVSK